MLPTGARVLDYGCGTGYGTRILCNAGLDAYGYDPDPALARFNLVSPVIPDGPWDAVVCFEVLEHIEAPPLATYMQLERLAPIVIASVPYLELRGANPHHRWYRLQEATFPGRHVAYQYSDGTISALSGNAQNLIVCTF